MSPQSSSIQSAYYAKILTIFRKTYTNDVKSELDFVDPYQLIIAVSLSAQCTDKKVNEITPALFKKFPDFLSLEKAKLSEVENLIRQVNYYKTKSKNLLALAKAVNENFSGVVPLNHDSLITLPGVGRKTANVVLGELKIVPSIPVDTHVFRVSKRLEIAEGNNPVEVEKSLAEHFKPKDWYHLHHWLIYHGRRVCKAQRPLCEECNFKKICPSSLVKE